MQVPDKPTQGTLGGTERTDQSDGKSRKGRRNRHRSKESAEVPSQDPRQDESSIGNPVLADIYAWARQTIKDAPPALGNGSIPYAIIPEETWRGLAWTLRQTMGEWIIHRIPTPPDAVVNTSTVLPAITFLGITWIPDSRIIDLTRKDQ